MQTFDEAYMGLTTRLDLHSEGRLFDRVPFGIEGINGLVLAVQVSIIPSPNNQKQILTGSSVISKQYSKQAAASQTLLKPTL